MRNLLLLLTMFIFSSVQSQDINIIPKPKSLQVNSGSFVINKKTPIIVQTALSETNTKSQSFRAGCDDYVTKPVNRKELLVTLSKFLR